MVDDSERATPGLIERLRRRLEAPARPVPALRAVRITLRTAHLLGFGAYFGALLFRAGPTGLHAALGAALATGLVFAALEAWRSPAWIVQVRGVTSGLKLALLALGALAPATALAACVVAAVLGSIVSHAPGRIRYHSLLHGRVVHADGGG